jgi:hypothetical protein
LITTSPLIYHPQTTSAAVKKLRIGVKALIHKGDLTLHYELTGDLDNLLIPEPQSPEEADQLWQHTCVEAFIAFEDETRYHEFNFSPSGQCAAYAFNDYRVRKDWQASKAPTLRWTRSGNQLLLEAVITHANLPDNPLSKAYRLGLSAVLEMNDAKLSYWALCHPRDVPDFHHRGGFTLTLQ